MAENANVLIVLRSGRERRRGSLNFAIFFFKQIERDIIASDANFNYVNNAQSIVVCL